VALVLVLELDHPTCQVIVLVLLQLIKVRKPDIFFRLRENQIFICLLVFHTCSVHTLMIDNFLSVAGVPAVESSSHTQIESSIANTNMDPSPSSSIPDHHSAHQYQGSCFSLAVVP